MKTTSVIAVALMAISASVFAGNEPVNSKVVVVNQKEGVFKVIYESEKAGKVTMTISDESGNVLFKEGIKSVNGFIRPVNFLGMQPGVYTITISDESGEQIQNISYKKSEAVKSAHIAKIGAENKYLLAVANGGANEIVVKIFDGENNLVHSEVRNVDGEFGVVYNLNQISGTPTFQVTDAEGNSLVR